MAKFYGKKGGKGKKEKEKKDLGRCSPSMACNNGSVKVFHCFQHVSDRCSKALYENRTLCSNESGKFKLII